MNNQEIIPTARQKEILNFIASNQEKAYPTAVAKALGTGIPNASEHLKNLMEAGLVKKGARSTQQYYDLTDTGWQVLVSSLKTETLNQPINLRSHKIQVKCPINSGQKTISENDISGVIHLKRNEQLLGEIQVPVGKVRFKVTTKSLLVHIPEKVYPPTEQGVWYAYIDAIDIAEMVKKKFNQKYPDLKFGRSEPSFTDSHYAFNSPPWVLALGELGVSGIVSEGDSFTLRIDRSKNNFEVDVEGKDVEKYAMNLVNNLDYQARNCLEEDIVSMENRIVELESASNGLVPN